jgi:hypothetical protein
MRPTARWPTAAARTVALAAKATSSAGDELLCLGRPGADEVADDASNDEELGNETDGGHDVKGDGRHHQLRARRPHQAQCGCRQLRERVGLRDIGAVGGGRGRHRWANVRWDRRQGDVGFSTKFV